MPQSALAEELGLRRRSPPRCVIARPGVDRPTRPRITEAVKGAVRQCLRLRRARLPARPTRRLIILLVLFTLGGVLMLGGTLDGDLPGALGCPSRTWPRCPPSARLHGPGDAIAAAYALVIGFVGAILGAGVGVHPGHRDLAAADGGFGLRRQAGPFLDIPWLLILAVGARAAAPRPAAIVGLSARSQPAAGGPARLAAHLHIGCDGLDARPQ